MLIDSVKQAFVLPEKKKVAFTLLREDMLTQQVVSLKTLQRFAGKCISFMLAVPAARLYTREVNLAISKDIKNSRPVALGGRLKTEISHWAFLDKWEGFVPWRKERHLQINLATDASLYKWGAVVEEQEVLGDFFVSGDDRPLHIPCGIPRIWKPASPCGSCSYPYDDDAKFCQSCGNYLEIQSDEPVDLIDIMVNERIRHLDIMMENTPYCKKVSALEKEFSDFLSKKAKSILFTSPEEVRKFLIVKDCKGKTQVHEIICPNLGKSGIFDCPCPLRLSSSTVRTMLGQLKRIFENYGKGRSWDEGSNFGNPIASKKVQRYLEAITREQAISHRVVKQAKPLFFDKLRKIAILIDSKMVKGNTTPEKFILLRDQAFLKLQFFAGDRASDLGKCLSQEIRRLRDDSGFVITHTVGKTLSNGKKNEFSVMRLDDHSVCPVFGIEKYVSCAGEMGINLTLGYLFRILDCSRKRVLEAPVSHSVMYGRLKSYLWELGMDEGETPHGIRGGCAVTLAVSGFGNSQDIMDHVGWFSRGSLDRYSRLGKMADKSTVGNLFKQVSDNPSYASSVYDEYGDTSKLPTAF
ncbi:uncharacterized protein [Mytilus edulis]|uniref:uncharacterized protein n=1 Tax=Mytilus edulis TaxID=6550 RepID=UPI0039EF2BB9